MGKILLIEDDGAMRELVKEKLCNYGHDVEMANSCTSAMSRWIDNNGAFDCIILDLNLNPKGLDSKDVNYYFPVHGILVLNKICEEKSSEEVEKIWGKTFIFSGFNDYLFKKREEFEHYSKLKFHRKERETSISDLVVKVNNFIIGKG